MNLPLTAVFADLPDPRRETANKLHALTDILVLATCAVIGGCDTWDDIAEYADTKEEFFRRFLPLEWHPQCRHVQRKRSADRRLVR